MAHYCIHAGRSIISPVLVLLHIWSLVFNSHLDIPLDLSCFLSAVLEDGMVGVVIVVTFITVLSAKRSGP